MSTNKHLLTVFADQLGQPAQSPWLGQAQERARTFLAEGDDTQIKALLGPAGAGKTTLACSWLKPADVAMVARGTTCPSQLAAALLASAGLDTPTEAEKDAAPLLKVYLNHQLMRGRRVRVVVDDCDSLSLETWQLLVDTFGNRSLPRPHPGPTLLLVGRPPAGRVLLKYLSEVNAGIPVHGMALPSADELERYMRAQVGNVGETMLITEAAIRLLARSAQGQFRIMNALCRQALLRAISLGQQRVNVAIAREIVANQGEPLPDQRAEAKRAPKTEEESIADEPVVPNDLMIVTYEGELIGRYPLTGKTLVGRSCLNDIVLESAYLSRHHAAFFPTVGGWRVSDLNSANGIKVNGNECRQGDLGDGHIVEIGPFRMKMALEQRNDRAELYGIGDRDDTQPLPQLDVTEQSPLRRVK